MKIINKKFFLLILFLSKYSFSQGLLVRSDHPVYEFLDRIESTGIIENFYNEIKPLTRTKIASYLTFLYDQRTKLNQIERRFLDYYISEFSYDIFGNLNRYEILIGKDKFDLKSNKPKFIYAYRSTKEFSFFMNSYLSASFMRSNEFRPANLIEGGMNLYGSISNFLGYEVDLRNGIVRGEKEIIKVEKDLRYNFKLFEKPDSKFFDRTFGYLDLEFPFINIMIGRTRNLIGYGLNKLVLDKNSVPFDILSFNLSYRHYTFDYFHGWLTADDRYLNKYIAHHRLSFSPTQRIRIGIGEALVYFRPSPRIEYLNPFNFYKSIEHSLKDKDNSLLYFDLKFIPHQKIKLYSTFLIDDIDFEKIGKNWYGNKTAFQIGANYYYPMSEIPVHFTIEYIRIEPYTYSHRFIMNNYTNNSFPLATDQPPNSYKLEYQILYAPSPFIFLTIDYSFSKRGKNYIKNGQLVNVGGDINLDRRETDSEFVKFLDGEIEKLYSYKISFSFEIIRDMWFKTNLQYDISSQNYSTLNFSLGLISFL